MARILQDWDECKKLPNFEFTLLNINNIRVWKGIMKGPPGIFEGYSYPFTIEFDDQYPLPKHAPKVKMH